MSILKERDLLDSPDATLVAVLLDFIYNATTAYYVPRMPPERELQRRKIGSRPGESAHTWYEMLCIESQSLLCTFFNDTSLGFKFGYIWRYPVAASRAWAQTRKRMRTDMKVWLVKIIFIFSNQQNSDLYMNSRVLCFCPRG